MSNSDIPLLTDVVHADDEHNDTGSSTGADLLDVADMIQPEDLVASLTDLAVFEPDDSKSGDTAPHRILSEDDVAAASGLHEAAEAPVVSEEATLAAALHGIEDIENLVAELQTRIASHTFELTDELMRAAFSDIEARVFRQISTNLREQLPELIDSVVREQLLERYSLPDEGE